MIKSKQLNDAGWKVIASKSKIKDNGLLKALEMLKKVDDQEKPDEAAKILAVVNKLALALTKDKTVAPLDDVVKYLGDMLGAVATTERAVEKAKAAAENKAAAKAKADEGEDDKEDDEDAASKELLTTKQLPLLRMVLKGQKLETLVAKSGKKVVMMLSRKPIPPARRRILSEHLGGGSAKYYPGVCSLEAGTVTFTLSAEVAGLTKLVKAALLQQTGLRVNKVKCRGDDGDDKDSD